MAWEFCILNTSKTHELMSQLLGSNRNQLEFFCLESAIAEDSIVRIIEVLVDVMPITDLGFMEKGQSKEGRPAYSAGVLLKLYLYGYFNRVRSSRRLERECQTNLEAIWLLKGLKPCFRTIAGFRQDNSEALGKSFSWFNRFLRGEELFSREEVATDGTKIRGQNSRKNNYNEKKVNQHLSYIDNQIRGYLEELDLVDMSEEEEHQEEKQLELSAKLDQMTVRRQKYEALSQQVKAAHEKGETQISTTDPDVRALPVKLRNIELGYNVIATAESKNKLITNFEVRNTHDTYALSKAGIDAREVLGLKPGEKLRQLADKGFDTGSELKKCQENDIETYVATKRRFNPKVDRAFRKDKFRYDEKTDTYICPAGQAMTTTGTLYQRNKDKLHRAYSVKRYRHLPRVCQACEYYTRCVSKSSRKRGSPRYVERSQYDDYIEDNKSRTLLNKETYGRRQQIIEHPFGTIKRQWGYDYTLLKGLKKVSGEWAIIFWVYNLRRSLTILGQKELRRRLREGLDVFFRRIRADFKLLSRMISDCGIIAHSDVKQNTMRQSRVMSLSGVLIS